MSVNQECLIRRWGSLEQRLDFKEAKLLHEMRWDDGIDRLLWVRGEYKGDFLKLLYLRS